jgi:tetratricopeptide (TPR) repeat protein
VTYLTVKQSWVNEYLSLNFWKSLLLFVEGQEVYIDHHRRLPSPWQMSFILLFVLLQSTIVVFGNGNYDVHGMARTPICGGSQNIVGTDQGRSPKESVNLMKRPPFLNHVSKVQVQKAIEVAEARHRNAVQRALHTYPVWDQDSSATSPSNDTHVDSVSLQSYRLNDLSNASTCLPDYGTEIPTTVYVTDPPLLSNEECAHVVDAAETHFYSTNQGAWTRQRSGQYEVSGFDIHEVPAVKEWFLRTAQTKLLPLLQRTFQDFCGVSASDICIDNAYLFKYTPETGRRTDVHTDSGCLSFTIALSSLSDYDGGGTWFQGLDASHNELVASGDGSVVNVNENGGVLNMDVGQITIRPGGVKHCGYAVTRGTRYIIGGFCIHRKQPEHVRMLLQRANDAGSEEEHRMLLEAAIVLNPGCAASYNFLANSYIQSGYKDTAQQIFEYCMEHVDPMSSEVAYALASLYLEKQMFSKASECLSICLKVDPLDVEAMFMAATVASHLGDVNKEKLYYYEIIGVPDAKATIKASAYCNLGVLHQGEESEIDFYRRSLRLKANNFSAMYSLACALASRKEWPEAIDTFKNSLEILNDMSMHDDATIKSENEREASRMKALRSLYTSIVHYLKQESTLNSSTTQGDMMLRFKDIMGHENFALLVASQGAR